MTNIVLTGMRGTGKSALAQRIAKTLKRRYVDIDKEIERQERMSISRIVNKKGWNYFRKIEKYVTRRISKMENIIISTGGGTIIDPENARKLKKDGIVILLTAPTEVLAKRIANKQEELESRPVLTKANNAIEELENVWQKRKEKYENSADYKFDISGETENLKLDLKEKGKAIIEMIAKDHPEFAKPE